MKIALAAGGKKEDEVPILPRFVSDSIVEGVKAEIEAVDQAKLVSGKRKSKDIPDPQLTKIVMKKKTKKTSAGQELCGIIGSIFYYTCILVVGISLLQMLFYCRGMVRIQLERHNNLVRYVNVLKENQNIVYNGINDVMTKVNQLTKNHNDTKDELFVVEYFVNDLHNDLQTLKDSFKHFEEGRPHSDDDNELDVEDTPDVVLDYPRYTVTSSPMSEGSEDSDDLHHDIDEDEEYPIMMSTSTNESPTSFETTSQATQREEYPVDYSEYDTEGKIYTRH